MSHPRRAHCVQCGHEIDPHTNSGHYQQVVGFVKLRARGANQVKMRRNRSIFICKECMDLLDAGHVPGQSHLWDTE